MSKETLYNIVQMKHKVFVMKALIELIEKRQCAAIGAKRKQIKNEFSQT